MYSKTDVLNTHKTKQMARRKKSLKTYRRRRIGSTRGSNLTSIAGIVGGAIVARMVVNRVMPNLDSRIKNAGVVAIGALLMPKVLKGEMGKAIGNGMIAVGGAGLVADFIPAIGAVDSLEFPVTVGEVPDNLSVIAGDDVMAGDDISVLAGMEDDDDML